MQNNKRKILIARLERELGSSTKVAFGKPSFERFVSNFSKLAMKSGDTFLLKFADKLVSYPDFMRDMNPVEFSVHFVRNVRPQGSSYRDTLSSESAARAILEKVVRKLREQEGALAGTAADFFQQASDAIRLP